MTDQPDPTLSLTTYEVIKIDEANASAEVRFENPYYSGACVETRTRPVLDPETGEPTAQTETYQVDLDPNPHLTKVVVVPLGADGHVDHDALVERLQDQARGVRARMDAARARQQAQGLGGLVGMTTPSE